MHEILEHRRCGQLVAFRRRRRRHSLTAVGYSMISSTSSPITTSPGSGMERSTLRSCKPLVPAWCLSSTGSGRSRMQCCVLVPGEYHPEDGEQCNAEGDAQQRDGEHSVGQLQGVEVPDER